MLREAIKLVQKHIQRNQYSLKKVNGKYGYNSFYITEILSS